MNYAEIFRALADENRIAVLEALSGGEMCASELLSGLNISQPTLSHHMKILTESGIVLKKKHGQKTFYVVSKDAISSLTEYFSSFAKSDVHFSDAPSEKKKAPVKKREKKEPAPKKEEPRQTDIWLF